MIAVRTPFVAVLFAASLAHAAPRPAAPRPVAPAAPGVDTSRLDTLAEASRRLPPDRRVRVALELERLLMARPELVPAALALATQDSPALAAIRAADPAAARAFDAALLHGLGALREPRALPLLTRALESAATPRIAAVAAAGLGRLCDRGGFDVLARHATSGAPRARDAYEALGSCRTVRTAELLAARLDAATDAREARALARGLGQLGSTWAWEALGPAQAETGREVRARCARALRAAYDRHQGSTRSTIRKALSLVASDEAQKLAR